jgi:hypothetical protein
MVQQCFPRVPSQKVVSEKRFRAESVEIQAMKRRLGGWCEMATN